MAIYTRDRTFAYPPDVEAEITFVPTAEGGRKTPAYSDYRPQFYYEGQDWDAVHEYPDVDSVLPGQTVRALLRFLSREAHVDRVHPDMAFQIREGARVVGRGRVTKILHLAQSAERARRESDDRKT
jgi:translation elongation factor EF-Tu-like GTPase